ncbi:NERD domain-containing protein [Pseudarthrobacter oxydans]|nr:NERD domain-containing protein [Pseudarthrobacter oxydans]
MKPATEPEAISSVAVTERPEPQPAPEQAPTFVYNPWKLKELRRLYINLPDGSKVGYLDLATLAAVPESGDTAGLLRQALAGLSPNTQPFTAPVGPAAVEAVPTPAPRASQVVPWLDLSANRPGQLIENLDDTSYKAGVAGEQRTAGVLAGLEREGYRALHSVPLSPRKDIDHLVIGPTGIHAVNTKASSYEVTAKDEAVYADGYRQKWIESIGRDAGLAGEYLARAARMELEVQPLVAVWSTIGVTSSSPYLVAGEDLRAAIAGAPVFPTSWVDVVYNIARRSDTWTANH